MNKGQGSLEYLLILAAILAIAVVVVVVANSLMGAPQQQSELNNIKYKCATSQIELVGFTAPGTNPASVNLGGMVCGAQAAAGTVTSANAEASCDIGPAGTPKMLYAKYSGTTCQWNSP